MLLVFRSRINTVLPSRHSLYPLFKITYRNFSTIVLQISSPPPPRWIEILYEYLVLIFHFRLHVVALVYQLGSGI